MEKYIGILKNSPLFRGLSEAEIRAVLERIDARAISKDSGEYILRAGDTTAFMGAVLSGSVMVVQEDLWGHRNIMNRIAVGDIFAEIFAAAPGAVLNVSVFANERSEIMLMNVGRLLSLAPGGDVRSDLVVRNLLSMLARKVLALNDKITHVSKRSTREKLLSFLSSEALRQGGLEFDIAYNRQQLADYLCVDRAAMSVELSKLQSEGLLSYNKSHFMLKEI